MPVFANIKVNASNVIPPKKDSVVTTPVTPVEENKNLKAGSFVNVKQQKIEEEAKRIEEETKKLHEQAASERAVIVIVPEPVATIFIPEVIETVDVVPEPIVPEPVEKKEINVTPSANHHILIVDGKTKKVGKRSQYLLDMLTIDHE
jgi:hypothetical protein